MLSIQLVEKKWKKRFNNIKKCGQDYQESKAQIIHVGKTANGKCLGSKFAAANPMTANGK